MKNEKIIFCIYLTLSVLLGASLKAQDGQLDASFAGGRVINSIGTDTPLPW